MKKLLPTFNFVAFLLVIIDVCLFDFSLRLVYFLLVNPDINFDDYYLSFYAVFCITWLVSALINRIYRIERFMQANTMSLDLMLTYGLHLLVIVLYVVYLLPGIAFEYLITTYAICLCLTFVFRFLYINFVRYYKQSAINNTKVVILGVSTEGISLYNYFQSYKSFGYTFLGFFDQKTRNNPYNHLIKGNIEDLKSYCRKENIDEIYLALPNLPPSFISELQKFADANFIYLRIVVDEKAKATDDVNIFTFDNVKVMSLRKEPLSSKLNQISKRAFDIFFSFMVISLIFPWLFPIIALLIKMEDSSGPVFFVQKRPGKKNRLFGCYKFRSMRVNNSSELQASKGDSRITKIGGFLRKTSLDELPQFFNVLLGDMSVVGPRPNMVKQLEEYSKTIDNYQFRHFVTPGITGYAQVSGFRGETREHSMMEKRVKYDVMYMEKWSLFFDIKIIFLTVWNAIRGEENAY
ncbi:MAG: undecaprenyl-phosphate glucose phosphotransferase [Cytophagales bacterium]|nr:MAG: undecaprenyl-phosphate glucose phosphotransferase [Cytophagales bacterium]